MLSSKTVCLSGSNSIDKFSLSPPTYTLRTPTTKTRATITAVAIAIAIAVTIKGYGGVGANVELQMTTRQTHTHKHISRHIKAQQMQLEQQQGEQQQQSEWGAYLLVGFECHLGNHLLCRRLRLGANRLSVSVRFPFRSSCNCNGALASARGCCK